MLKKFLKYFFIIILLTTIFAYIISVVCPVDIKIYMSSNSIDKDYSTYEAFYDRGDGYNGKDGIYKDIKVKDNKFVANFKLRNPLTIKNIRFDPPSNIAKNITINAIDLTFCFFKKHLNLKKLYNSKNINFPHDIKNIYLNKNAQIELTIVGYDPFLQIIKHFNIKILPYIIIISLLLSIISIFIYYKFLKTILKKIFSINNLEKLFYSAIIFLFLSIIITKLAVTLIAIFYYKRNLTILDIFFTYITDFALATIIMLIGLILLYWVKIIKLKVLTNILLPLLKGFIFIVILMIFILSIFYLLSGYIFLEWGAFIEYGQIEELLNHNAKDEFLTLFFRMKTYIFLSLVAIIIYFSIRMGKKVIVFKDKFLKKFLILITILVLLSLLAIIPYKGIYKYKPSTQSPILLLFQQGDEYTHFLHNVSLKDIDTRNFNPIEKYKRIDNRYKKYENIAKDMNIIFYIMESVRKKNVSVYGYKRDTMPNLKKMIKSGALVFHNAYVNQPRSCKTMSSLLMGTYPDPRLVSIVWKYYNIKDVNLSFIKRLKDNNYTIYFGAMQENEGGDQFGNALRALTKNSIMIQDPVTLLKNNPNNRARLDERLLIDNFLNWTKEQNSKFSAILWTKSAHMAYISPIKKWKEKSDIDKYDNCLFNLDRALKSLVNGLKKQKKLENTLIVILGDHGEALGDKLDWGHGNYLYEHSMNIPFIIYNNKIFKGKVDIYNRFQIKDISSTILYMLGIDSKINQSINIFAKKPTDTIYLSNVHQDYKLGLIYDNYKFVYRPKYELFYLYDLKNDPNEEHNIIREKSKKEIEELKLKTLKWYKYQIDYLNKKIYKEKI